MASSCAHVVLTFTLPFSFGQFSAVALAALCYFGATGGRVRTTFLRSPFHRRPRLRRHMTEPSESESTSEWIALTAAEVFLGT